MPPHLHQGTRGRLVVSFCCTWASQSGAPRVVSMRARSHDGTSRRDIVPVDCGGHGQGEIRAGILRPLHAPSCAILTCRRGFRWRWGRRKHRSRVTRMVCHGPSQLYSLFFCFNPETHCWCRVWRNGCPLSVQPGNPVEDSWGRDLTAAPDGPTSPPQILVGGGPSAGARLGRKGIRAVRAEANRRTTEYRRQKKKRKKTKSS